MDGDKELIDKLQHVWHSARPFPQEPWDRIIALVREHDGRRWERLHSASKNTRAWLSRNGLEGISAYDDLVAALDAIPQSAEPPTAAETLVKELETENAALKREVAMWRSEHDPCPFSLENETLRAEVERLDKRIEGLIDKYEGCPHTVDCGCAQDKPSDICAHHAPQLRKALAENERLDKQIARFLEPVSDEERRVANHWTGCWTKDEVEALIANRLEPKGCPINPPQEPK